MSKKNKEILFLLFVAGSAILMFSLFQGSPVSGSSARKWVLLLMIALAFPAVMLSGITNMGRSRAALLVFAVTVITSGALLIGSDWFGGSAAWPHMWHKGRKIQAQDSEAFVVYFHVQNNGRSPLKLTLDPVLSPGEVALVMTSQQYDEAQKQWLDYPIERLLSEHSKSMFPLEIRSGGSLILEMIFVPPREDSGPEADAPAENPPGRYSVSISDPVKLRIYHHEINIPPFSSAPA